MTSLTNTKKSILWSVLSKYDGLTEFNKFCDSISNLIQEKYSGNDLVTIYQHFTSLDKSDYNVVNEAIGFEINNHLFSIS